MAKRNDQKVVEALIEIAVEEQKAEEKAKQTQTTNNSFSSKL